jgi:sugar phosphate isomerase/epimerase
MVEKAQKRKINLCHENEHNIYGENPDDCADLMKYFGGALKSVFDNGNFAFTNYNALDAYDKLNDYIEYFHIKDAYMGSEIVPAGMGDGKIYEVLSEYNKITNRDVFLTLEPHLTVFGGLDKLANVSELKMGVQFESAEKAFDAATEALRNILKKI